jgi:hypothetical protein
VSAPWIYLSARQFASLPECIVMVFPQPWDRQACRTASIAPRRRSTAISTATITRNNPIEDIETHLPLRVLRYELREDVAGAGKWRGGLGSVREFTFLSDGGASVEGEGHRYRPWGFLGGREGMPAKLDLLANGTARAAVEGAAYEHRQGWPLRLL